MEKSVPSGFVVSAIPSEVQIDWNRASSNESTIAEVPAAASTATTDDDSE